MHMSLVLQEHLVNAIVRYATEVSGGGVEGCEDDVLEQSFFLLEQLSWHVGMAMMHRLTLGHAHLFSDDLDVVKFLCRDMWPCVFGKPVDNLKTNHKGTFVLHDHGFPWVAAFKEDMAMPEAGKMATLLLAFPCGLLRGALSIYETGVHRYISDNDKSDNPGSMTTTHADIVQLPHCAFQIRRPSAYLNSSNSRNSGGSNDQAGSPPSASVS